jgi:hypothetical protein
MKPHAAPAPLGFLLITLVLAGGCAFDISHVEQLPVNYAAAMGSEDESFTLVQPVTAKLGTGFPTRLNGGTRWRMVGHTEYGKVFATKDQILTVEASNIYEAQLVVADQSITGFYLPVEKKFVRVKQLIRIETQPPTLTPAKSP